MCGICGFVHRDQRYPFDLDRLMAMRDVLEHRGPDDAGYHLAPGIGLASRRLAIVDLSPRGHMPMTTPEKRFWIVYNGEVYNFKELRAEMELKGVIFQSDTDTEVVLRLYENYGPGMLERLNGMFAFAIWDEKLRTVFLARDRMGVKPLYYALYQDALYFASEAKALFMAGVDAEFDQRTWEELLCFRYVAGERTPFTGVRRLLPGHYLRWENGRIRTTCWWNLRDRLSAGAVREIEHPVEWFQTTFDSAVSARRLSDVPLGVFLSGGLDSSSVAATVALQAGSGVASYTMGFHEPVFDERHLARLVVNRWNLEPHEITLSPNELLTRLHKGSWYNDEPLAHASDLHLWALAEHAKSRVSVLLSGEGADELLGGYVRYEPLRYPLLVNAARPFFRLLKGRPRFSRVDKFGRFLELGSIRKFVLFNACEVFPGDLLPLGLQARGEFEFREEVLEEAETLYPGDMKRQAMHSDQRTFLCSLLDRNDKMTMAASIECRTPFLDHRLVEGIARLPSSLLLTGRQGKYLLRQALGARLPAPILSERKWGFAVPWYRYMREFPDLTAVVRGLSRHQVIREGPFDTIGVQAVVQRFLNGDDGCGAVVKRLLMISVWHDAFFGPHRLLPLFLPAAQQPAFVEPLRAELAAGPPHQS